MELKFDVKIDRKLIAAVTKMNLKKKFLKIITLVMDVLALFFLIRGVMRYISHKSIIMPAFLFVFILVMFHIVLPLAIRAKIKGLFKELQGKTIHYKINDEGFYTKSEFGESHTNWKSVTEIVDLDEYVSIMLIGKTSAIWLKKNDMSVAELDWIKQHPRK